MPRVLRTVVPRIRRSLREGGLVASLSRSFLLPVHLLKEYRAAKSLHPDGNLSDFDQMRGVDTGGEFGGWTYLSDLTIPSPNWIDGIDHLAIDPERFEDVLGSFDVVFKDYTFIDFGSGKGRALLLASEFPFKQIIGLEFSPQLHQIAENNIRRYRSTSQQCSNIQCLNLDLVDFNLPNEPLVLFFFDPCRVRVLSKIVSRIGQSLLDHPRPLYVAYVAPRREEEQLLASTPFLKQILRSLEHNFCIYRDLSSVDFNSAKSSADDFKS